MTKILDIRPIIWLDNLAIRIADRIDQLFERLLSRRWFYTITAWSSGIIGVLYSWAVVLNPPRTEAAIMQLHPYQALAGLIGNGLVLMKARVELWAVVYFPPLFCMLAIMWSLHQRSRFPRPVRRRRSRFPRRKQDLFE